MLAGCAQIGHDGLFPICCLFALLWCGLNPATAGPIFPGIPLFSLHSSNFCICFLLVMGSFSPISAPFFPISRHERGGCDSAPKSAGAAPAAGAAAAAAAPAAAVLWQNGDRKSGGNVREVAKWSFSWVFELGL